MAHSTPKGAFWQANPALWALVTADEEDLESAPDRFKELRDLVEFNKPEIIWPDEPELDGPYL